MDNAGKGKAPTDDVGKEKVKTDNVSNGKALVNAPAPDNDGFTPDTTLQQNNEAPISSMSGALVVSSAPQDNDILLVDLAKEVFASVAFLYVFPLICKEVSAAPYGIQRGAQQYLGSRIALWLDRHSGSLLRYTPWIL
ncbi:hypothetical protein SUGI_0408070 [Cryptomeria japonica]|nr:hypothetical protein SUGI_0408070 [Cryptomeria japonica]